MPTIEDDLTEATKLRKIAKRPGLSAAAKKEFEGAANRLDKRAGNRAKRTARPKSHVSNANLL